MRQVAAPRAQRQLDHAHHSVFIRHFCLRLCVPRRRFLLVALVQAEFRFKGSHLAGIQMVSSPINVDYPTTRMPEWPTVLVLSAFVFWK